MEGQIVVNGRGASGGRPGRQFKIAVFGGKGVGKTTLSVQYVESHFVESHYPTNVQNEFTKMLRHRNQEYTLEIIDTAGQNECSIVNMNSLDGCSGIILCYSVVNRESFELISHIWDKITDYLGADCEIPVVIVANKVDLRDRTETKNTADTKNNGGLKHCDMISKEEGEALAKKLTLQSKTKFGFIEISTKLNINVDEAVMMLLKMMEERAYASGLLDDDGDNKCSIM